MYWISFCTWSTLRAARRLDAVKKLFRFLPDAHHTLASEEWSKTISVRNLFYSVRFNCFYNLHCRERLIIYSSLKPVNTVTNGPKVFGRFSEDILQENLWSFCQVAKKRGRNNELLQACGSPWGHLHILVTFLASINYWESKLVYQLRNMNI